MRIFQNGKVGREDFGISISPVSQLPSDMVMVPPDRLFNFFYCFFKFLNLKSNLIILNGISGDMRKNIFMDADLPHGHPRGSSNPLHQFFTQFGFLKYFLCHLTTLSFRVFKSNFFLVSSSSFSSSNCMISYLT